MAKIRGEKAAVTAVFLDDESKRTCKPDEVGGGVRRVDPTRAHRP